MFNWMILRANFNPAVKDDNYCKEKQMCHVLGPAVFTIFVGDTDSGIECSLSRFADVTQLGGAVTVLEGSSAVRMELDRFERQDCVNQGRLYCTLSTKRGLRESWARACSDRTRKNGFNKEGRVRLDISKKFFYCVLRTDFLEKL